MALQLHINVTGAAKGEGCGGTAPLRNWVHEKIPGCTVELNTQYCAWFGSQISLITAMSFREAMPPRTTHQGLCPWTPLGDFRSPDPLCPHLQILSTPLINVSLNRPPDCTWRRPPGRPRDKWLDQLQNDSNRPIGDLWRRPWTWWCNDATELTGYATMMIMMMM